MLEISFIRAHAQVINMTCQKRGLKIDVQKIIDLDSKRKRLLFLLDNSKKEFVKLKETKKYYDDEYYNNEKTRIIKEINDNKKELKETIIELKKNMFLLPNIIDMQVPFGNSYDNAIVIKEFNVDKINKREGYKIIPTIEFFKRKHYIDSGKVKTISDKNDFLMQPLASKIYISSWNTLFNYFSNNNYLPFSAPQYLNKKFSNIFDLGVEEKNRKSALVLTSFFTNRFLNFGKKFYPKKFFSFRQQKREDFFDDFIFSALLITTINQIETDNEIDKLQESFSKILEKFNIPYKILLLPIGMLKKGDNKRIAIQAYYPAEDKYKTILEIAYTRDFYTRRLSIRYKKAIKINSKVGEEEEGRKEKIVEKKYFPYMIYTSELNSFELMELIVQNNQDKDGNIILTKNF